MSVVHVGKRKWAIEISSECETPYNDFVHIKWDESGLVPAVCQSIDGTVLMLAWMNEESLTLTQSTKMVHFWSRSRSKIWKKGETSGHTLTLVDLRVDCDRDCLLAIVTPSGPACHTGSETCYFERLNGEPLTRAIQKGPGASLLQLEQTVLSRRSADAKSSYTKSLFAAGTGEICKKIAEESQELIEELMMANADHARIASESADLLFHLVVGLVSQGVALSDVFAELERRTGQSGLDEKRSRPGKN